MEEFPPLSAEVAQQREDALALLWRQWWQEQLPWQKTLWLKRHREMRDYVRCGVDVRTMWD